MKASTNVLLLLLFLPLATSYLLPPPTFQTTLHAKKGKYSKGQSVDSEYDVEVRDMTRNEMLQFNKDSEDNMMKDFQAMTAFSLVISLPIFYLCWVAFFSD